MFKVNNKNTRTTSTYFTPFSGVSIIEFERVNVRFVHDISDSLKRGVKKIEPNSSYSRNTFESLRPSKQMMFHNDLPWVTSDLESTKANALIIDLK